MCDIKRWARNEFRYYTRIVIYKRDGSLSFYFY